MYHVRLMYTYEFMLKSLLGDTLNLIKTRDTEFW